MPIEIRPVLNEVFLNVTTVGTHGVLQTAKLQKKRGQETYL